MYKIVAPKSDETDGVLSGRHRKGDNVNCELGFYDRFRERIAGIKTVEERNGILSDMQEDFTRQVRNEPDNRDRLSEVYQLLKQKWVVSSEL